MKKFLFALLFIGCSLRAHAANCLISGGASTATIQAAVNAAATNSCTGTSASNLAQLSAGTYSVSSQISLPCPSTSSGMVFQGPVVPLAKYTGGDGYVRVGYTPTAKFTPSSGVAQGPFGNQFMSVSGGCGNPTTIQYIETDYGHGNPDGGGAVYVPNNASNITITRNWFHGNWANPSGGETIDSLILLDGGQGGPTKSNITISWNRLGNTGDCQNIMSGENYDGNSESDGGLCNAVGSFGNINNLFITNNFIYYQEQGLKFYEGGCTPDSDPAHCSGSNFHVGNLFVINNRHIEFNDFSNIHRIPLESQTTPETSYVDNNVWHDMYLAGLGGQNGSWMISVPEGPNWACGVQICNTPGNEIENNTFIYNVAAGGIQSSPGNPANGSGPTIEFWGSAPYNNNFSQGYAGCMMQFGFWTTGPAPGLTIYNNIARMYNVNTYGFTCNEESVSVYPPGSVQSGQFNSRNFGINSGGGTSWQGTINSQQPTISPSGGSFSGAQTVTLSDPGYTTGTAPSGYSNGYGPPGNTGIWYTTDGSTPVPGQGTAQRLDTGGTFSISSPGTTTVKAVGMYGAGNQMSSYPSPFGWAPSGVVTAVFNGSGGTPTAQAPVFSPGPQTFGTTLNVAITTTTSPATIYYTVDGTTPTTSSPVYTSPIPITATTTLQAFATASGFLPSSITTGQYTYSLFLGNPIDDLNGGTYQNVFNWVYAVTSTASGGYNVASCSMNITAGQVVTGSAATDCVLALAPTPTTIATSALCHGTYSNAGSTSGPGLVTVPMTGCGVLPPATGYWIGAITSDSLGPSPYGFSNCGGGCTPTPVPTVGSGTYNGFFQNGTYGNYSSLTNAMQTSSTQSQPTISLSLSAVSSPTAATPVISPATESFSGTITVSISDVTAGAEIHYTTDGSTPSSASPVYSASFPITATTTVNAIAIATGFTNSSVATATYTLTAASIAYSYLGTTTNLNWTVLSVTVQFFAVVGYSDGIQTQITCAGNTVGCRDSRGTYINTWVSQFPGVATMTTGGVFTPVSLTAVGSNGQQGLDTIQAQLTSSTGGTFASSFWFEALARSSNSVIQGGTLDGITVY